ncbi:MAG TPA: hypothetical protein PL120_02325 [Bacilli bacterium]|nr:hypothetical protein [Bacilli bacterium]
MSDSQFWVILIVILAVGGLLYLASGFIYVHKGYMAVIEKDGKFYAVKPRGLYFFLPMRARRVGMYKIREYEDTAVLNGKTIVVRYNIKDYKTFHYSGREVTYLLEVLKKKHPNLVFEDLKKLLPTLGIEIISIKEEN